MFILSAPPRIVPWRYRPFFWLSSDKKKDTEATSTNIRDYFHTQDPKPGFWKSTRPIDAILAGITAVSGIGLITSFIKENKLWQVISAGLAVVGAAAFGWFKYHASDYIKTSEEIKASSAELIANREKEVHEKKNLPIKINRESAGITKTHGTIPITLWDGKNHPNCTVRILEDGKPTYFIFDSLKDLNDFNSTISPNDKIDTILVGNVDHETYKAEIGNHKIDILIPQVFARDRKNASDAILNALEEGLSVIPENLIPFIKTIKLNTGKTLTEYLYRNEPDSVRGYVMGYNDGLVEMYHGSFNGPSDSLDGRERFIIDSSKPDTRKLSSGRFLFTSWALMHEIGHGVSDHIAKNLAGKQIQIGDKSFTINEHFADGNFKQDWNNNNDAWTLIAKADGNDTSGYGKRSPSEDFAESFAGFITDPETFKNMCPNRWAFLNMMLPQIKIQSQEDEVAPPLSQQAKSPYSTIIEFPQDEKTQKVMQEKLKVMPDWDFTSTSFGIGPATYELAGDLRYLEGQFKFTSKTILDSERRLLRHKSENALTRSRRRYEITSILSNEIFIKGYQLSQNKTLSHEDIVNQLYKSICGTVGFNKKFKVDNKVSKAIKETILKSIKFMELCSSAIPAPKLVFDKDCLFDPTKHEAAIKCKEDGYVKYTIFPGFVLVSPNIGKVRVLEKPKVFTDMLDKI